MKLVPRERCPVCESKKANDIYNIGYDSEQLQGYLTSFYGNQGYPEPESLRSEVFVLSQCESCGMVFQRNIPDPESMTELYTRWISYDKVYGLYVSKRDQWRYDKNFLKLRTAIKHFGGREVNVFDYGFGYAELLKQAVVFGMDAYGLEFNANQVELARAFGIKAYNGIDQYDFPKMDLIFCEQVLEHVVEPRLIMADLVRLSKPGSILHMNVPDAKHVFEILKTVDWSNMKGKYNSVNAFAPLEHINSFRGEQFLLLARDFGFEPFGFESTGNLSWEDGDFGRKARSIIRENRNLLRRMFFKPSAIVTTSQYFVYRGV